MAASDIDVSVLFNSTYVDTSHEGSLIRDSLSEQGYNVSSFSDISAAGWTAATAGADVLVIPELENGNLFGALSADARAVITAFVNDGGILIQSADYYSNDTTLANGLFGFTLVDGGGGSTPLDTVAASGTPFEGGPASVPYSDGTYSINSTSLPIDAINLYHGVGFGAYASNLFYTPVGAGFYVFLGFDWFTTPSPAPWEDVLARSVSLVDYTAFSGTDGNDTLDGDAGNNRLFGDAGDDVLNGLAGNDLLVGGAANDTMTGGSGADRFEFRATEAGDGVTDRDVITDYNRSEGDLLALDKGVSIESTTAIAGGLRLTLTGGDEIDVMGISDLSDLLVATVGVKRTTIVGGAGDDVIVGTGSRVYVFAGAGNDSVEGDAGNDTLLGEDGSDTLNGGAGNDWIHGGAGDDVASGGDGNDSLYGKDGNDTLSGDAGNDVLVDRAGDDSIDGGDGNDTAASGIGNDTLNGGAGNDRLSGEADNDSVSGDAGNDTLFGNGGDDALSGGDGDDTQSGGIGNDTLIGDAGNDSLLGNQGDDQLAGGSGDDTLNGGAGNDMMTGNDGADRFNFDHAQAIDGATDANVITDYDSGEGDIISLGNRMGVEGTAVNGAGNLVLTLTGGDTVELVGVSSLADVTIGIFGTSYRDNLIGTTGADSIFGLGDNDLIAGDAGNDWLQGDDGDDKVVGGTGDDTLIGGAGRDSLIGGTGNDSIDGGADSDTVTGGNGDDTVIGGDGYDTIAGDNGDDWIAGGLGRDNLSGGAGNDTVMGGDDNDNVSGKGGDDSLFGDAGDDRINGNSGNDTVLGGDGNDKLFGGAGDDSIDGGTGADTLHGGGGGDTLTGGDGIDTFAGTSTQLSGDIITDFGESDIIRIDGVRFGAAQIDFDQPAGVLHLDTDSDGSFETTIELTGLGTGFFTPTESAPSADASTSLTFTRTSVIDGTDADETLTGSDDANDVINGHGGNDALYGQGDGDSLNGGTGEDTLYGGDGADTLTGGDGADTFVFELDSGSLSRDVDWAQWSTDTGGNGHSYAIVNESGSWTAANAAATDLGGYLATITSAAENTFITNLALAKVTPAGSNIWLGGYQPAGSPEPAGNWQWVTGEPFSYTNWYPGEPNNSGGQDLLQLYTSLGGRWDDLWSYSALNAFVVESNGSVGEDSVTDFTPGTDKLDLTAFHIASLDDLADLLDPEAGSTVIHLSEAGGRDVVLDGVNILTLSAGDFLI